MERNNGDELPAERTNVATPRLVAAPGTPLRGRKLLVIREWVCLVSCVNVFVCYLLPSLAWRTTPWRCCGTLALPMHGSSMWHQRMHRTDGDKRHAERMHLAPPRLVVAFATMLLRCKLFSCSLRVSLASLRQYVFVCSCLPSLWCCFHDAALVLLLLSRPMRGS